MRRLFPLLALAITFAIPAATAGSQTAEFSQSASTLIDINTATPSQLKSLPGMGDAYVRRVLEGRPYTAKNQLITRGVLPQPAYEKIAPYIIARRAAH